MNEGEVMNDVREAAEPVTYELGYHVLPTVLEEEVAGRVAAIKEAVEKHGGAFVSEAMPAKIQLAYPISKEIEGRKYSFGEAYFGWMAFDMSTAETPALEEELKTNPSILRHLLIRIDKEAVLAERESPAIAARPESRPKKGERAEGGAALSEEELDQTIRDLVAE